MKEGAPESAFLKIHVKDEFMSPIQVGGQFLIDS